MKTPVRMLKSQSGFSLIELMIVVAIIGILASIAIPNFKKFKARAYQTEGKGYLSAIYSGEKSFQNEFNEFSTCMEKIGFDREPGTQRYSAGFRTAYAGPGAARCVANARGTLATVAGVTSTAGTATFLALSTADLSASGLGGAGVDGWTIDDTRTLANPKSGL